MPLRDWIDEFLDMLRRRRDLILGVIALGAVLSVLVAFLQSHRYQSTAVLQVQGAKVDGDQAAADAAQVSARQLQLVDQAIMSRGEILEVGRKLGLLDALAGLTETEQVGALRKAVNVNGVAAARAGPREDGAISLIRISAEWTDRAHAQALAAEIARRTIERSTRMQRERARQTVAFFKAREAEIDARIARLEEDLTAFRRKNALPDAATRTARQAAIERLRGQIVALGQQVLEVEQKLESSGQTRVEKAQRKKLTSQLASLTEQRDYVETRLAAAIRADRIDPDLEARLAAYQRDLVALRAERDTLRESRKAAEIRYQIESTGQSARFKLLEEASWPDYPVTSSRTKIALVGLIVSVIAALGLGFALDLWRPVMRSAALMQRDLGYAPIATIPDAAAQPRPLLASLASLALRVFGRWRGA